MSQLPRPDIYLPSTSQCLCKRFYWLFSCFENSIHFSTESDDVDLPNGTVEHCPMSTGLKPKPSSSPCPCNAGLFSATTSNPSMEILRASRDYELPRRRRNIHCRPYPIPCIFGRFWEDATFFSLAVEPFYPAPPERLSSKCLSKLIKPHV